MSELRERLVHALETVIKDGAADPVDGTHYITAELMLELINSTPNDDIIYCKDCAKHNKGVGDLEVLPDGRNSWIWKDRACPLVSWRGKAQGHEFDYQYCACAERRADVSD